MEKANSKYLCIFGGGAVRGYSYLGVLKAFQEVGFCPQKVAGSSVGSVFAAFYALDIPLLDMEFILKNVNFELFKDINFKFTSVFSISKGGVFLDWLREHIEKAYYKEEYKKGKNPPVCFKDIEKDLIIVATDLTNSVPFIFSKETTPDYEIASAIRASASLPGLLTPVHYGDKLLADGDLMKSNPLWNLHKVLCPDDLRILELRLEGGKKNSNIKNMIDYFNAVQSCVTNYSTDFIIDVYSQRDKFDYIKIDTKDLLLVNFNINNDIKKELVLLGYNSTMKFFQEDLPAKRIRLKENYEFLSEKFSEIEKYLAKNEIKKIKTALGDTFEYLSDIKKDIDKKIHKKIKKFRILFIENLSIGFLGSEKIKDKKLISEKIKEIEELLQNKEDDLTGYTINKY